MRLIAQEPRNPPNDVKKYLLLHEREHQVITVRMHPAVLLAPVGLALAGLVGAVVLNGSALKQQGVVEGRELVDRRLRRHLAAEDPDLRGPDPQGRDDAADQGDRHEFPALPRRPPVWVW